VTVLVVMRDPYVRALLGEMLTRAGTSVLGVGSEMQALDAANGTEVGLLVVELAPDFDGRSIVHRFRVQRQNVPVLFVTRYYDHPSLSSVRGEIVLTEPFSRDELTSAVALVLLERDL
jgi:DNA-binding response OmpR family regulator